MPELPPWMVSNPLAPVPLYLQGFGQGAQIGTSRRNAEMAAYEQELQQQAQQERNEILREAKQIQAQQFAQDLKLKQDEAAIAARQAAEQLEGRRGLERGMQFRISQGATPQEAFSQEFPMHASKLFSGREQSLAQVMEGMRTQKQYIPKEATVGGRKVIYNEATGAFQFNEPPTTERIDEDLPPGRYRRGNQMFTVPEPKPARIHPSQRALDSARAELAAAKASKYKAVRDSATALEAKVKALEQAVGGITPPSSAPTEGELVQIKTKEEYDKLPLGSDYIAPDGSVRHKQ